MSISFNSINLLIVGFKRQVLESRISEWDFISSPDVITLLSPGRTWTLWRRRTIIHFPTSFYLTPSSLIRIAFSVSFSLLALHCFSSCLPGFKFDTLKCEVRLPSLALTMNLSSSESKEILETFPVLLGLKCLVSASYSVVDQKSIGFLILRHSYLEAHNFWFLAILVHLSLS